MTKENKSAAEQFFEGLEERRKHKHDDISWDPISLKGWKTSWSISRDDDPLVPDIQKEIYEQAAKEIALEIDKKIIDQLINAAEDDLRESFESKSDK